MRDKLDGNRTALVFGLFLVGVHVLWALMVLLGLGQKYLDWMFNLHMLSNPITVMTFSWGSAITLLIAVFIVGYILGWVFTWAHNLIHKK